MATAGGVAVAVPVTLAVAIALAVALAPAVAVTSKALISPSFQEAANTNVSTVETIVLAVKKGVAYYTNVTLKNEINCMYGKL